MKPTSRQGILAGDRVSLRLLCPSDARHIQRWLSDSDVCQWLARRQKMTKVEAVSWVNRLSKSKTDIGFGIVPANTNDIIGITALYDIDLHHGTARTGTIIGEKKLWKRGYATAAKNVALEFAFNRLKLHVVEARILHDDKAARALLRKTGYRVAGRFPKWYRRSGGGRSDMVTFYLTKDRWQSRRTRT